MGAEVGLMQTRNPLLDDLARLMSGALAPQAACARKWKRACANACSVCWAGMDLPTREEFER